MYNDSSFCFLVHENLTSVSYKLSFGNFIQFKSPAIFAFSYLLTKVFLFSRKKIFSKRGLSVIF